MTTPRTSPKAKRPVELDLLLLAGLMAVVMGAVGTAGAEENPVWGPMIFQAGVLCLIAYLAVSAVRRP